MTDRLDRACLLLMYDSYRENLELELKAQTTCKLDLVALQGKRTGSGPNSVLTAVIGFSKP